MKTIIMALAILLAALTTTSAQPKQTATYKHKKTKVATKYTCEMHSEVVKS